MAFSDSFSRTVLIAMNFIYILVSCLLIGVASYETYLNKISSLYGIGLIIVCGISLLFVAMLGIFATIKQHQVLLFYYIIILGIIFVVQFFASCACLGVNKEKGTNMMQYAWEQVDHCPFDLIHDAEKLLDCCGYNMTYEADKRFNMTKTDNDNYWVRERNWCHENIPSFPKSDSLIKSCVTFEAITDLSWHKDQKLRSASRLDSSYAPVIFSRGVNTSDEANFTSTLYESTPKAAKGEAKESASEKIPKKPSLHGNDGSVSAENVDQICPRTCADALENTIEDAFSKVGGLGLFFAFTELLTLFVAYLYRNQSNQPSKIIF